VELRRLELLTLCLQIVVINRVEAAELLDRLPVSHRDVPLVTVLNGTLMARDPTGMRYCRASSRSPRPAGGITHGLKGDGETAACDRAPDDQ
jgi:hypothetical protein